MVFPIEFNCITHTGNRHSQFVNVSSFSEGEPHDKHLKLVFKGNKGNAALNLLNYTRLYA